MDTSEPTTRLTEREKEALRLWLDHKSAKEIALDLGISHHAVEKRLKMARTKLDAASSLEAARMLAAAEGYQQTVAGPAELQSAPPPSQSRRYQPIVLGGIAMSLALVFALALAPAQGPATEAKTPAPPAEIRIEGNLEPIFDQIDENRSGYLESPESPFVELAILDLKVPVEPGADHNGNAILGDPSDPAQAADFYDAADKDGDGRISFREYHAWHRERLAALGIDTSMVVKVLPEAGS
jgi:DNA-binding CsgD family transcriptional regulator